MQLFRGLSINRKITAIIMFISGIVLVLSFAAIITTDLILYRSSMIKNLSTLADIIGTNSTAALIFNDPDAAEEILEALSVEQNIVQANIYTTKGRLFASYHKGGSPERSAFHNPFADASGTDPDAKEEGYSFDKSHLSLYKRIVLDNEHIGTVQLHSTLNEYYYRMELYMVIGAVIMLASILLAFLLSSRLQHVISEPILNLAHTMNLISKEKRYSLRAEKHSDDELGSLIDGFNEMLSLIQARDEELEKHSDHLENLVRIRTSELSMINEELKETVLELQQARKAAEQAQKMEAIGTLAGGVAHDLNNILAGLVGYPQLLLMEIPEDSPLRRPIMTMQKSGEKAAAVVQDLLTLARRGVSVKEVVNLNDIVYEYLKSHECATLKKYHPDVHIEADLDHNLMHIVGSPVHLSKTLMNLVSNAAEAMPDGGNITVKLGNCHIQEPIQGYDTIIEGDYVVLSVSDTGVGISREDKDKIFEPFYTKKVMGRSGTGLGMAVVLGAVQDHSGYITVQSVEGEGTVFTLYFPATRQELSKDTSLISIQEYTGNGETILIVDDVEEQRATATAMLRRLGYKAVSVPNGEEAIEYVKNNKVDLLVLDMIMDPGIDGLETYKRISEFKPGQKAIIASGFTETNLVKQAQSLGVGTYVKKPYLLESIGIAVKTELKRDEGTTAPA
ncbi:MAG TPA: CHASE sensor domain-containing protein [Deltaproteobacteria bacterium]|nr:CHASE sensor domain-containing protein [Deltaproteobacteria bacterium]